MKFKPGVKVRFVGDKSGYLKSCHSILNRVGEIAKPRMAGRNNELGPDECNVVWIPKTKKGRTEFYRHRFADLELAVALPVGTKIRFIKGLTAPACGDHPELIYARKGETGEVTGHGCSEGHYVKTDVWPNPFGAILDLEFEVIPETREVAEGLALSIMQPWGWLIVNGHKDVENRDWPTKVRGEILVHVGQKFDMDAYEWIRKEFPHITMPAPDEFPRGGIIGQVRITDCVEELNSPWFFGRYGFTLADAKGLPFSPCKGMQKFFRPNIAKEQG